MKQMTIYCNKELVSTVNQVLHKHGLEGFIHMPGIFGNKLKSKGSLEKDLVWQAEAFVIFPDENQLKAIMADLQEYANECSIKPCLRMVVVPIEAMY